MKEFIINKREILQKHDQEWLVTNGMGGFACGTISGTPTRKYHSLLNASLPAPFGRTVMLNFIHDEITTPEENFCMSCVKHEGENPSTTEWLVEFRLENGIPFWKYEKDGIVIEKSLFLIHHQNTLCIFYELLSSKINVSLIWRPYFHLRMHDQEVNSVINNESYTVRSSESKYEIECPSFPIVRILNEYQAAFVIDNKELNDVFYEMESLRGYEPIGNLKSPGYFLASLYPNKKSAFMVSVEEWKTIEALQPEEAFFVEKFRKKNLLKSAGMKDKNSIKSQLILAADQFLITPITRFQDMIRLQAAGEEVRSIIAGFPWFSDWGRDTMISLEGLTLCTGRFQDAHAILHTYSYYIKGGLIPNMFPDGSSSGFYNTADASLWFFHAIDRYIQITGDIGVLEFLLPRLQQIIEHHVKGTFFGIRVDKDGLLIQGENHLALTWMDAKLKDWVVTPRRGKAVEINALWYNALRLFEKWTDTSLPFTELCYRSFNEKFWNDKKECLYDVIEGENGGQDPAVRPNQLFAISLTYPVLEQQKWKPVLKVVQNELLTPFGLRTLSPQDPQYQPYYHGNLTDRDAAYHQGTVWPWLIGPFIDVWLKAYPNDRNSAKQFIEKLENQLYSSCMGTIGEIFDAKDPYQARGCFAQAWSVAEVLRSLCNIESA